MESQQNLYIYIYINEIILYLGNDVTLSFFKLEFHEIKKHHDLRVNDEILLNYRWKKHHDGGNIVQPTWIEHEKWGCVMQRTWKKMKLQRQWCMKAKTEFAPRTFGTRSNILEV